MTGGLCDSMVWHNEKSWFDPARSSDSLGISESQYLEVVRGSFNEVANDISELDRAFLSKDRDCVKSIAHRLKGLFATLGIEKLRQPTIAIEVCALSDKPLDDEKNSFTMLKESFIIFMKEFKAKYG